MVVQDGVFFLINHIEVTMARNNFQYEKRQRELEKKRKADEKAKRKLETKNDPTAHDDGAAPDADADGEDGAADDTQQAPAATPSSLA
jgi:hypothetical protein